jgi:hypothetical protein
VSAAAEQFTEAVNNLAANVVESATFLDAASPNFFGDADYISNSTQEAQTFLSSKKGWARKKVARQLGIFGWFSSDGLGGSIIDVQIDLRGHPLRTLACRRVR